MWRSSGLGLLLAWLVPQTAGAFVCLPPMFEGGTRLSRPEKTSLQWLEPLLRQHEVCWRGAASPDERRVFVYGNSAIFGFPHPSERTAVANANRRLREEAQAAHLYNLGMVYTYQAKDAVVLHESLRFAPDVVVYALTLADLQSRAPPWYKPLQEFLLQNSGAVDRFLAEQPPGLVEPLERITSLWEEDRPFEADWRRFRQLGLVMRVGVAQAGGWVRRQWFPEEEPFPFKPKPTRYACRDVKKEFRAAWKRWQEWSVLPYLERLRQERGIEVLVVNWPVVYDPVGECYNRRYPTRDFEAYNRWLAEETAARGLHYLDLHDLLTPGQFEDSVHPTVAGQDHVAMHLHLALRDLLSAARAR